MVGRIVRVRMTTRKGSCGGRDSESENARERERESETGSESQCTIYKLLTHKCMLNPGDGTVHLPGSGT